MGSQMKICVKCTQKKDVKEFTIRSNGKLNSYCKECVRKAAKKSYKQNREKCIKRSKEKNLRFRKYIFDYLSKHPCVDCKEKDPVVLQFDHISDKKHNISDMKMMSLDKVKKEIEKCEIRCANCHARKTAKQFGYYNFINNLPL